MMQLAKGLGLLPSFFFIFDPPAFPLSPNSSPCGKKFRSKPQIARFLGESADLTAFDFSRAGTPGDGSSRRRARDRTARRAVEASKPPPPLVKPLTNNPLRPSGPIRRTCGVIKLPVTWVKPPSDEEVKVAMIKLLEAEANNHNASETSPKSTTGEPGGELAVSDQLKGPPAPAPAPPPGDPSHVLPVSSSSVVMVPALWENRLQGVMAYDHETGHEIQVDQNSNGGEKLHNGLNHLNSGNIKNSKVPPTVGRSLGATPVLKPVVPQSVLNAVKSPGTSGADPVLSALQVVQRIQDAKAHSTSSNVIPSLLAHRLGGTKSQQGPLAMVPSLKNIKENGNLKKNLNNTVQQQSHLSGLLTLPLGTSGSLQTSKQGTSGSGILVTGTTQKQNLRTSGSANGPVSEKSGSGISQGLFVSESDLRLQEEKVRVLREQLMAAQSTV